MEFAYAALLYDFYSPLLTSKQKQIIEMYYMNDMSLSEIGEELGISRQAAGILISRAGKNMSRYESKLELIKKYLENKKKAEDAVKELRIISERVASEDKMKIDKIISIILEEFPRGI